MAWWDGELAESDFSQTAQSFIETSLQSRTTWGPFFERKTRKMRPHGGWRKRVFNEGNWGQIPITARSMPAALGSSAAHRSKAATFAMRV